MLQINDTILSFDIIERKFVCNLDKCKGACCIHGDSGAPLEESETIILDEIFPIVKKYMRKEGIDAVESQGAHVIDTDNDKVTPLINGEECAYVFFEQGIAKCAIEKAWTDGLIPFQKPLSCHLYPIRITKYTEFDALNYHKWEICKAALQLGKKTNTYLYNFLEQPLIRKYGKEWYEELKMTADVCHKEVQKREG